MALCHSRSFLQFNKRHAFTLASRYRYRSIPLTKTATHKHRQVSKEKSCRGVWYLIGRCWAEFYSWNRGISINSGPPSKNAREGTLSLCYQPDKLMSTAGPPLATFFFQCLQKWLVHVFTQYMEDQMLQCRLSLFPSPFPSLCLNFPKSRLKGLLGSDFLLHFRHFH